MTLFKADHPPNHKWKRLDFSELLHENDQIIAMLEERLEETEAKHQKKMEFLEARRAVSRKMWVKYKEKI